MKMDSSEVIVTHQIVEKMAEENTVVFYGMWASPYAKMVEIALQVKGVAFKYVEEDLMNKSESLLKYNPVHKKVPVLVHKGKPIVESLVILEYIDETWKNNGPSLLPQDPYQRAQVRFWAAFLQQQVIDKVVAALRAGGGEAHEEALKEVRKKLKVFEGGLKDLLPNHTPFVNGHQLRILEIIMASAFGPYKAHEQAIGIKVIDQDNTPFVFAWLQALIDLPIVKQAAPPHDKMVVFLQFLRQLAGKLSAA